MEIKFIKNADCHIKLFIKQKANPNYSLAKTNNSDYALLVHSARLELTTMASEFAMLYKTSSMAQDIVLNFYFIATYCV